MRDYQTICKLLSGLPDVTESQLRNALAVSVMDADRLILFLEQIRRMQDESSSETVLWPSECLTTEQIDAYLFDELDPEQKQDVERHLESCEHCRPVVEALVGLPEPPDTVQFTSSRKSRPPIELPNYEFISRISRGGLQGEVWRARYLPLQRERAVKLIKLDIDAIKKLRELHEEVAIMNRLPRHLNLVSLEDFCVVENYAALCMELLEGESLQGVVERDGPLSESIACQYVAAVGDALSAIHEQGILHRDVKPDNIKYHEGQPVLVDFGVAAFLALQTDRAGTPGYIAPELRNENASEKADVFSLAATLFTLLAGHPPFDDESVKASFDQASAGLDERSPVLRQISPVLRKCVIDGLNPIVSNRCDLASFISRVRGGERHALATELRLQSLRQDCILSVTASVQLERVGCGQDSVLDSHSTIRTATGQPVRLQVRSSEDGFLNVINISSEGKESFVSDSSESPMERISIGKSQTQGVDLKTIEPAGADHILLIWSRNGTARSASEWLEHLQIPLLKKDGFSTTRAVVGLSHYSCPDDVSYRVVTIQHSPPDNTGFRDAAVRGQSRPAQTMAETIAASAVASGTKKFLFDQVQMTLSLPPTFSSQAPSRIRADLKILKRQLATDQLVYEPGRDGGLTFYARRSQGLRLDLQSRGMRCEPAWWEWKWAPSAVQKDFEVSLTEKKPSKKAKIITSYLTLSSGPTQIPCGHLEFSLRFAQRTRGISYRLSPQGEPIGAVLYQAAYLSSAAEDTSRACELAELLKGAGMRVSEEALLLSPEDRWRSGTYRMIADSDVMVLLWSEAAARSFWVHEEVAFALRRGTDERQPTRVIVDILSPARPDSLPKYLDRLLNDAMTGARYFLIDK